jgi:arsenate reductase-like glutaredoxin family protein
MEYGVLRSEGYSERAIFIIDKNGIIQYIDIHDIDDQPSNEELWKVLRKIDPSIPEDEDVTDGDKLSILPRGGIIVYCTPWCPNCRKAISWLEEHGLDYTLVNISSVPGAAKQVRIWANGNRTTPTFDIDGVIVVDWKLDEIVAILSQKGYL